MVSPFQDFARRGAEGASIFPGCNRALHQHPLFSDIDVYNDGKPTRIANSNQDIRKLDGVLPVSDGIQTKVFGVPWFKKFYPEIIDEYTAAFKKVIGNYKELLAEDTGDPTDLGRWMLSAKAVSGK